jgi:hypothetical protein
MLQAKGSNGGAMIAFLRSPVSFQTGYGEIQNLIVEALFSIVNSKKIALPTEIL